MRRFVLGVGALLIVGGWGATSYADARQQVADTGKAEPITLWLGESTRSKTFVKDESALPSKTLYTGGVIGMALGAAILVIAFPRGSWHAS